MSILPSASQGEQRPTTPQSAESEAEARVRAAQIRLGQYGERAQFTVATYGSGTEKALHEIALTLSAEVDRLRAELAKYVGAEPTIAEEMAYLNRCLNAVYDLCDEAEKQATRWEHPLSVPEWVEAVCKAADGERPDTPGDKRRRVYVDGKGNGWIDAAQDDAGEQDVIGITDPWKLKSTAEVAAETGSLREIGRCW